MKLNFNLSISIYDNHIHYIYKKTLLNCYFLYNIVLFQIMSLQSMNIMTKLYEQKKLQFRLERPITCPYFQSINEIDCSKNFCSCKKIA